MERRCFLWQNFNLPRSLLVLCVQFGIRSRLTSLQDRERTSGWIRRIPKRSCCARLIGRERLEITSSTHRKERTSFSPRTRSEACLMRQFYSILPPCYLVTASRYSSSRQPPLTACHDEGATREVITHVHTSFSSVLHEVQQVVYVLQSGLYGK